MRRMDDSTLPSPKLLAGASTPVSSAGKGKRTQWEEAPVSSPSGSFIQTSNDSILSAGTIGSPDGSPMVQHVASPNTARSPTFVPRSSVLATSSSPQVTRVATPTDPA